MPAFPWLYETVDVPVTAADAGPALEPTPALRRYFTLRPGREILLFPDETGVAFVRPAPDGALPLDGTPVLDPTLLQGSPLARTLRLIVPTADLVALVRYVQRLGMSRGAWRDAFEPQTAAVSALRVPDSDALRELGREVYRAHCVGCHGEHGDGAGPAATFLFPRPRDFTAAVFKFQSTPAGALPTDGDLYRTITRGVRGTAMPTWHEVTERERLAVVAYIKTLSSRWRAETPPVPPGVEAPPPATPELLARGRRLYAQAKCAECHGDAGRGDGPSAARLRDDFDAPIRPLDFARGQFKGGASVADVYRAMTNGLSGTPMPSYADSMTDAERWAISYYVLAFSAWTDPLTGERLRLSPETRAALDSPRVRAHSPETAFDPARPATAAAPRARRYYPGVSE
jgi:cytochrome c oxidase cbb3-type subunit 2